jgi:hypothetical protein
MLQPLLVSLRLLLFLAHSPPSRRPMARHSLVKVTAAAVTGTLAALEVADAAQFDGLVSRRAAQGGGYYPSLRPRRGLPLVAVNHKKG